jgi:hypothetical protein
MYCTLLGTAYGYKYGLISPLMQAGRIIFSPVFCSSVEIPSMPRQNQQSSEHQPTNALNTKTEMSATRESGVGACLVIVNHVSFPAILAPRTYPGRTLSFRGGLAHVHS